MIQKKSGPLQEANVSRHSAGRCLPLAQSLGKDLGDGKGKGGLLLGLILKDSFYLMLDFQD